jgi:hypothetical protein
MVEYKLTEKELMNFGYKQSFNEFGGVILEEAQKLSEKEINNKMLLHYNPNVVYMNPGVCNGFGDAFGWASFVCRLSEASGKTIKLSKIPVKSKNSIETILQTTGRYQLVKPEPNTKIYSVRGSQRSKQFREIYSWLFLPTRIANWQPNKSRKIAYQFGHGGATDRLIQDINDETRILDAIRSKGYEPIELGGSFGDIECVKRAAMCEFFVGTCSGMSHLCHSVGVPTHIITNLRSLERVSAGHVKNSRSPIPTTFWQHPNNFISFINTL